MDIGLVPSVYVKFQGPDPVNPMEREVMPPVHMVAVPLITAVGIGET
jgi:hypothetical protein